MGVGKGDGIIDLDDGSGGILTDAAEEEAIDGVGPVLEGVKDELDVRGLGELIAAIGGHGSRSRGGRRRCSVGVLRISSVLKVVDLNTRDQLFGSG